MACRPVVIHVRPAGLTGGNSGGGPSECSGAGDPDTLACHALLNAVSSRTKSPELHLVLYGTATVLSTDFTGCQRPGNVGAVDWKVDLLGARCPRDLTRSTRIVTNTQQLRKYTWHANQAFSLGCVFRARTSRTSQLKESVGRGPHTRAPLPD